MVWGFCVYFVYMIPLETDVLRKHRFQKWGIYIWKGFRNLHKNEFTNILFIGGLWLQCIKKL